MPLTSSVVQQYKGELKLVWEVLEGKKIRHEFKFANFVQAMAFVNQVAAIAEEENHHPDLHIFYNRVVIELWTHAVGGLSENDFILAAKIEKLLPDKA